MQVEGRISIITILCGKRRPHGGRSLDLRAPLFFPLIIRPSLSGTLTFNYPPLQEESAGQVRAVLKGSKPKEKGKSGKRGKV